MDYVRSGPAAIADIVFRGEHGSSLKELGSADPPDVLRRATSRAKISTCSSDDQRGGEAGHLDGGATDPAGHGRHGDHDHVGSDIRTDQPFAEFELDQVRTGDSGAEFRRQTRKLRVRLA